MRKVAEKNKGVFVVSEAMQGEGLTERLGEYIGVKSEMYPTLRIVETQPEMKKFVYEEKEISEKSVS